MSCHPDAQSFRWSRGLSPESCSFPLHTPHPVFTGQSQALLFSMGLGALFRHSHLSPFCWASRLPSQQLTFHVIPESLS